MADDHYSISLHRPADYEKAGRMIAWLGNRLGQGWTLIATRKRTLAQNALMWSCLGEIAKQTTWFGMKLPKEDWKLVFLDALKVESRAVPNWENNGFLSLRSSSRLSKEQMTDMIEIIYEYGSRNGVTFKEAEA